MLFALVATGCGTGAPTNPSRSAVVTFQVANQAFGVQLTTNAAIEAAMKAQGRRPTR